MAQVLWGTKTPGQAYDQRDEVILANKRKVRMYVRKSGQFIKKRFIFWCVKFSFPEKATKIWAIFLMVLTFT
jgi:hypothetical protein